MFSRGIHSNGDKQLITRTENDPQLCNHQFSEFCIQHQALSMNEFHLSLLILTLI